MLTFRSLVDSVDSEASSTTDSDQQIAACSSDLSFQILDTMANAKEVYPEPPSKKRNDLAIELISGSVGGATQVIVGQVNHRHA